MVPEYSEAKIYIDPAVLDYYDKPQNRTTAGRVLFALLDALLGSEDGVQKLYKRYLEIKVKNQSEMEQKGKQGKSSAGMSQMLDKSFLTALKRKEGFFQFLYDRLTGKNSIMKRFLCFFPEPV